MLFHSLIQTSDFRRLSKKTYLYRASNLKSIVPQYSSITFRRHFRLTKHAVEKICTLVGQSDHLKFRMDNGGRIPISIPKQLLVTLWYLGNV